MKKLLEVIGSLFILSVLVVSCEQTVENEKDDKLTRSANIVFSSVKIEGKEYEIVKFGEYPQTIKDSSVTVDETKQRASGVPMDTTETIEDAKIDGALIYCQGSDGAWYYKCTDENAYDMDANAKYSDGTKAQKTGERDNDVEPLWFKVEPIKWQVVTDNYNGTGKKLLVTEKIHAWGDGFMNTESDRGSVKRNNYKESKLRSFITASKYLKKNGIDYYENFIGRQSFLKTAFTEDEQARIATTNLDNTGVITDGVTNIYACDNTEDKIFLLSYKEVMNPEYFPNSASRAKLPTDFAIAKNLIYADWFSALYWLRTPDPTSDLFVLSIGGEGIVEGKHTSKTRGLVLALCLENDLVEP
ncbi:MAG: hypothetical protein J6I73_00240 [Treponema sp.]|nr:hypothetical protein [Treponema sp.]